MIRNNPDLSSDKLGERDLKIESGFLAKCLMAGSSGGQAGWLWVTLSSDFSSPNLTLPFCKMEGCDLQLGGTVGVNEMQECKALAFGKVAENPVFLLFWIFI